MCLEVASLFCFRVAATSPNLSYYKWLGACPASYISIAFAGKYEFLDEVTKTTEFEVNISQSRQDDILDIAKHPHHGPRRRDGWKQIAAASDSKGGNPIRFRVDWKTSEHIDGVERDGVRKGSRGSDLFP
jgi:acetylcholinesterase